jgi:hypothetical protein
MNKTDYLKALTDARKPDPVKLAEAAEAGDEAAADALPVEPATPAQDAAATLTDAAATPPQKTASTPATAATPPAEPKEPELFKGESLLDPETRKAIRERWEAAQRLTTVEAEAKTAKEQYDRLHGKLAPVQQQLSRMQVEYTRLQQKLNEHESKKTDASTQALRDKINSIRERFPEDAEMWDTTLDQVNAANQRSSSLEEKLSALEQRERLNEERQALTAAHPDWHKKTARVVQTEQGYVVQRTIDTPEAQEMEVWANGMDPYERQVYWPLFGSQRAQDAIALLNRFDHDRAIAKRIAEQANGDAGDNAAPGPSATPAPAALAPDPDPSRRTTAPSATRGQPGQPMSEKKRQLIDAAAFLRNQREAKAKAAVAQRR